MFANEKTCPRDHADTVEFSPNGSRVSAEVDDGWKYLDHHRGADATAVVDISSLRRRIDWRLVPLLFMAYILQLLDKVVYNVRQHHLLHRDPAI